MLESGLRSERVSKETPKKPPNPRKARYPISSPWLSFLWHGIWKIRVDLRLEENFRCSEYLNQFIVCFLFLSQDHGDPSCSWLFLFLISLNPGSSQGPAVICCLPASDLMIALLDGSQVDDGTAWEISYFYRGKPKRAKIIGVRTLQLLRQYIV